MALPFGPYQGQDLTSYEEGNKFLPREFYSLNYTPSQKLASTVGNSGITNTEAAYPYKWPPEGGGGGGGGLGKYNLNPETQKDFMAGVWSTDMAAPGAEMTASYKPENRKIAQDQSGNWKFVDSGKNVYHGNINVQTPGTMILDKMFGTNLKGKYGLSDEFTARKLGSTMGYELDDEELDIGTRRTVPQNIITRWRENREIKKAEEKAAADKVASQLDTQGAAGKPTYGGPIAHDFDPKQSSTAPTHIGAGPLHGAKDGGRIGYNRGRVVNPGGYNGVIDRNIANLKAALEYSDLTPEERAQLEADLQMSIEAKGGWEDQLLSGDPVSKAQGGLIGYFDGGIARLL